MRLIRIITYLSLRPIQSSPNENHSEDKTHAQKMSQNTASTLLQIRFI